MCKSKYIKDLEKQITMLVKDDEENQKTIIKLGEEINNKNIIIGKAIERIFDYQMNDKNNKNYEELLSILKGDKNE